MFKNDREIIEPIVKRHAAGEVDIPTELETIMFEEVKDIIRRKYNNKDGAEDLMILIKKAQG